MNAKPHDRGYFISLEGGDGVGKSTQAQRLAEKARGLGYEVVLTREPGGSEGAEAIRALLLEGSADRWSAMTETLLFYAARRDHIERIIRPALERGAVVITDRFSDSTRAYQSVAGGVAPNIVETLDDLVVEGSQPDLTLILDLPVDEALIRAKTRAPVDRIEGRNITFHESLRAAFLDIASKHEDRCVIIDAAGGEERVSERIWAAAGARLKRRTDER